MAKADRTLTIAEVMQGKVSSDYLDKKEKKAVIERRITKLANKRFDLEDKIQMVGEREDLIKELDKLNKQIEKAQAELKEIVL